MWLYIGISIFVFILLIAVWVIYNRLVTVNESVNEALAGIDVQLKKRFELVPKLVDIVKGYSEYEAELYEKLTKMRSNEKPEMQQKEKEDAGLNLISHSLKVTVEDYPDLKANTQFLKLMEELTTVEEELAMSRRYLNGAIRDYNTKIAVFPNVLMAGPFGFDERPFYEIDAFEREPQKIFE